MKHLHFTIRIEAPRERVWHTLFDDRTYRLWTRSFCEGSHFVGSWEEGERIRFLSPSGDGMTAVIAANRRYEFLSIKHLGYIHGGIEDTESPEVRAWAPAFENYSLSADGTATELRADLQVTDDFEGYMLETWPQALAVLKTLCEAGPAAQPTS